jgi:hypothetical protein
MPVTTDKWLKIQTAGSEEEYDKKVHKLGNLALIEKSINASISNKPIDQKRDGFGTSTFILTRHLAKPIHLGNTKIDKIFKEILYFKEWNLQNLE